VISPRLPSRRTMARNAARILPSPAGLYFSLSARQWVRDHLVRGGVQNGHPLIIPAQTLVCRKEAA
jgi:hypothetical protein